MPVVAPKEPYKVLIMQVKAHRSDAANAAVARLFAHADNLDRTKITLLMIVLLSAARDIYHLQFMGNRHCERYKLLLTQTVCANTAQAAVARAVTRSVCI